MSDTITIGGFDYSLSGWPEFIKTKRELERTIADPTRSGKLDVCRKCETQEILKECPVYCLLRREKNRHQELAEMLRTADLKRVLEKGPIILPAIPDDPKEIVNLLGERSADGSSGERSTRSKRLNSSEQRIAGAADAAIGAEQDIIARAAQICHEKNDDLARLLYESVL